MLTILDKLPEGILNYDAEQLYKIVTGPTLIHIAGVQKDPIFISVLLHGNEHSGWQAVQKLLAASNNQLQRSISLFIGNISAAKHSLRQLPGQLDYNRIWNGQSEMVEHQMVRQVLDEMRSKNVFAAVDIHNNTGNNPHYACINSLDDHFKYFARLFGPLIVYFKQPDSVLSIAFSDLCPTVTVECGQSGEPEGIKRVVSFLSDILLMQHFPHTVVDVELISIYQTIARIKVSNQVSIGFGATQCDLKFDEDLEQFNFREIHANSRFAKITATTSRQLFAYNDDGHDVTQEYFYIENGYILTRIPIIPAMLTQNIEIIKNDCLCYLMTQID